MATVSIRAILIGTSIAVAAALALPAAAQVMPKRKPGLWESQMTGMGLEAERMKQRVAQMTPQQRAQMEEMMKRSGMGFSADGSMIMRYCLTADEADMNSGKKLLGKVEKDIDQSRCEEKEFKRSGNELRFHTVCRARDGTREFDGHVYDITPTSMSMEMTAKSPEKGEQHMTQKSHWVSESCGNLK